jgi:hypothetical protein
MGGRLHRKVQRLRYLVHWRGYPDTADDWQPAAPLSNAPDKVQKFWEIKGQPCPRALSLSLVPLRDSLSSDGSLSSIIALRDQLDLKVAEHT